MASSKHKIFNTKNLRNSMLKSFLLGLRLTIFLVLIVPSVNVNADRIQNLQDSIDDLVRKQDDIDHNRMMDKLYETNDKRRNEIESAATRFKPKVEIDEKFISNGVRDGLRIHKEAFSFLGKFGSEDLYIGYITRTKNKSFIFFEANFSDALIFTVSNKKVAIGNLIYYDAEYYVTFNCDKSTYRIVSSTYYDIPGNIIGNFDRSKSYDAKEFSKIDSSQVLMLKSMGAACSK